MKKIIQLSVAVCLLSMGVAFMACKKNHVETISKTVENSNANARVTANAPGESMDWDGELFHDCDGVGTKCAVVYPDVAISTGWHDACVNGTLEEYIQNNGETFGFSQDLLQNLINGNSINIKEGNGGYQYRPIN